MTKPTKLLAYEKLKRRMRSYGGSFTVKLRKSLADRGNIAYGDLYKSIKTRHKTGMTLNELNIEIEMLGYGQFLNNPFPPKSPPPVDAILAWMDRKGIKINRSKTKYKLKTRRQLAFMIARSIGKYGFKTFNKGGHPKGSNHTIGWADAVIVEEIQRLKKAVQSDLRNAVREAAIELLDFQGTSSGGSKTYKF
jgi:hypothetical protein